MGGRGFIRIARPTALLGAVATLLAVLFVCLSPHGAAEGPDGAGHERRVTLAAQPHHEYSCPYDRGDCGLFPYRTPAVLTVPPLDPPPQADALVRAGLHPPVVRPAASDARPRAPDLHVLQVLRT
ncbi:hypothetical protein [Streptomyces ficellus]|uniref:DUF2946 domain-containing protein n=1 Tax=Streptomyces ficellus TaxID=1977088 RepID=A0A6I6FB25_9ACTN|nr:hypothetical protein [Streptomyces ficellus]QGV80940.1 hypothetical protein EIZ62_23855 [Streptomyces ficellus]